LWRREALGFAVAVVFHGAIGLALSNVDLSRLSEREAVVEMDVREPPPPPPPEPEPPKPEPPPEPVKPRIVAHRAPPPPVPQPPSSAPPPPNEIPPEPPKNAAPPVFGISMDSVVSGDANMAVAVGNTLMTKERKKAPPGPVQGYSPEGTAPPAPVPETELAEMPVQVFVPNSEDLYPEEARKLGIEAKVVMRLTLDEKGRVAGIRIVTPVGYGFEEAAKKAMRQAKFIPGKTSDGKAVPTTITYTYSFVVS
jgi:protein TonB